MYLRDRLTKVVDKLAAETAFRLTTSHKSQRGQAAIEYVLITLILSFSSMLALHMLTTGIHNYFIHLENGLDSLND